jgi:hypothetical protein
MLCPIGMQPIKVFGITAVGSIYCYDNICKWLENNHTDPLTGCVLPNKYVHRIEKNANLYIKQKAREIRDHNLKCNQKFKLAWESPIMYNRLASMTIDHKNKEWISYNKMKRQMIVTTNSDAFKNMCLDRPLDYADSIKRPTGTGERYQHIDLSGIQLNGKNFKSDDFSFANMENSTFTNCDFSRCRFIGTKFKNTIFADCRFIGEEITFYRATGNIVMLSCRMEQVNAWHTVTDPDQINKILQDRLLTCTAVVQHDPNYIYL